MLFVQLTITRRNGHFGLQLLWSYSFKCRLLVAPIGLLDPYCDHSSRLTLMPPIHYNANNKKRFTTIHWSFAYDCICFNVKYTVQTLCLGWVVMCYRKAYSTSFWNSWSNLTKNTKHSEMFKKPSLGTEFLVDPFHSLVLIEIQQHYMDYLWNAKIKEKPPWLSGDCGFDNMYYRPNFKQKKFYPHLVFYLVLQLLQCTTIFQRLISIGLIYF